MDAPIDKSQRVVTTESERHAVAVAKSDIHRFERTGFASGLQL